VRLRLSLILGALAAIGPLSVDMYLPAFPALAADLAADPAAVQRTLALYFMGLAAGQAVYGPLSDRFGRRLPLFVGLAVFGLAAVGCALAQDIGWLAALRLAQALGGCAGMVIARAVVRDLFDERGSVRMMANLMLVMGVAPILAPLLGGWLLAVLDWRAIFWALALYAALAIAAILLWLPESLPPARRRRDGPRQVAGVYLMLLRDRRFLGHVLAGALPIGGMFAYIAGSPFVVMELHGVSPQDYGWVFGANAAGLILASQVAGRLAHRVAPARMLPVGLVLAAATGAALLVAAVTGWGGFAGLLVPLFLFVASLGAVLPMAAALAMAPHGRVAGRASAVIGTLQFGVGAVTGSLVGLLHDGTARPMALLIAACGAAGLLAWWGLARPRG
jgi:DHA1 family bicyclomycin/chloramphenicol resistance-like MFS transporter